MYDRVFVNRTLNMKRINYIGLDMDHTLIRYKTQNFEALAHKIMCEKLVTVLGYPKSVSKLSFDFDSAIRGLVIDKTRGNLLKLSRYAAIRASQHGSRPIGFKDQNKLYKSTYIDLKDAQYDTVDTSFSISFAALFAQLVDLKDDSEGHQLPDYFTLANDLSFVLDRAHRDGSLKDVVAHNLDQYILKDEATVSGLERYISHGKKIFVLTNSDFHYTKLLLDYAVNPFLKDHTSWIDLFELVITSAQKPRFFYDNLQFLKIDPKNGTMTNINGPLTPGIYQGGCASTFTADLNLDPSEILYVGDHIYGDVVRLKKDCAWRTALVVEELEQEIKSYHQAEPVSQEIEHLMSLKLPIEKSIDELISEKIETGKAANESKISELIDQVTILDKQISQLIQKQQSLFNPSWGEIMRVGAEESYFAHQVERFACIYMARLSDMLALSPRTYFRSFKRQLAHEI